MSALWAVETCSCWITDLKIQKNIWRIWKFKKEFGESSWDKNFWRKFLRQKLLEKVPETKSFGESSWDKNFKTQTKSCSSALRGVCFPSSVILRNYPNHGAFMFIISYYLYFLKKRGETKKGKPSRGVMCIWFSWHGNWFISCCRGS